MDNYLLGFKIKMASTGILFGVCLQLVCACTGLCVLVCYKRQLNIDRTGEHPLKLIYRVLSMPGITLVLRIAVPLPTGRRIFHHVLILVN